jgi:hypothetical protein
MERPNERAKPIRDSGAVGGPATGGGVKYQVDVTSYLALDLIARVLRVEPTARQNLVVEPRLVFEDGVTRWDIRVTPDFETFEAKLNPSKRDINEWLERVAAGFGQAPTATFTLAYGDIPSKYLREVEALIRLSIEAADEAHFKELLRIERLENADEILSLLGDKAFHVAKQMKTWPLSERSLENQITSSLRYMVSPEHILALRHSLADRFLTAMKPRRHDFIPQLVQQLEGEGIVFHRPDSIHAAELPEAVKMALYVLQRCPKGLPVEILAEIAGVSPADFVDQVARYDYVIHESGGRWTHSPLLPNTTHPDEVRILGDTVKRLLAYIRANPESPVLSELVTNAVGLATICENLNPAAALSIFDPLDKPLKRAGRKKDVLELAQLTIRVANNITVRDTAVIEMEALATICGVSWTYQRIGDLAKAEHFAVESQKLGDSVGYMRNTAFCLKCRGRLRRVEAEREPAGKKRSRLINESIGLLTDAITTFSGHLKYGPESDEVADCNSLLARTYLSSRNFDKAEEHAAIARRLFKSQTSKHYMDLLLLEGEIASTARLQHQLADVKFRAALELVGTGDAERSEIAARAHLCRGLNLHRWKQPGAAAEIARASSIWHSLNEHYNAGVADWIGEKLAGNVPQIVEKRTKGMEPSLRVEVLRQYQQYTSASRSRALAQRDEITDGAWDSLVRRATATDTIRCRRW